VHIDLAKIIEKGDSIEFWFQFPAEDPLRRVVLGPTLQAQILGIDARNPEGSFHLYLPYEDAGGTYRLIHITVDLHFAPRRVVPLDALPPPKDADASEPVQNIQHTYFCDQCQCDRNITLSPDQQARINQHFATYSKQVCGVPSILPEIVSLDPHEDAAGTMHIVELVWDANYNVAAFPRNALILEPEFIP